MVVWCTYNVRRDGSSFTCTSHVTLKQRYKYTTSEDILNALLKYNLEKSTHSHTHTHTHTHTHRKKKRESLIQNHMQQKRNESAPEQKIALYKSDQLIH